MKPPAAPFVLLIRHADAGDPRAWSGDDAKRPLSERGHTQAKSLTNDIGDWPIGPLLSSPAVRCVQTLAPLAEARSLVILTEPWLGEGARAAGIEQLIALADEGVAACTHGDVLPLLLVALASRYEIDLGEEPDCSKASLWIVELGQRPRARYRPRRV